jgi:branched-chain amino acid transport system permease protein
MNAAVAPGRAVRITHGSRSSRAAVGVIVAVLGFFVPDVISGANSMTVLVNGLLLGLTALSVGFLLNLLGWVSFGGAAFSGAASYIFAILCISSHMGILPAMILGVVGATAGSAVIGLIFIRSKALVFTMLTLALGQLLLQVVSLNDMTGLTGAANGLIVTYKGSLAGLSGRQLNDATSFWPVVWAAVVAAVFLYYLLVRTRFGHVLCGIRENEERMRHAGFNTYLPKLAAFAFAGLIGAVSGVLQAVNIGFVSPELLSFSASGTAIIAALVGGFESPIGPIIGGVLLIWAQDEFGSTGQLFLYTGIAVIVVLVVFPRGVVGLLSLAWRYGLRITGSLTRRRHVVD